MGRDLQYARTDRAIVDAVLRLLARKGIEKISIADITEEALVNRSTFYQHYADKYAVLEHLQAQYIGELLEQMRIVRATPQIGFSEIDGVYGAFFDRHRDVLRQLLSIRTETFDLKGQLEQLLQREMATSLPGLSPLELRMLTAMSMQFYSYYLEHERANDAYSTLYFQSCLRQAAPELAYCFSCKTL